MHVLLFSGHMVDRPDRARPRFPASMVPAADRAIEQELARLCTGQTDRAVTSGASGGDLLFARRSLQRGLVVEIYLPFERKRFIETSVAPGGTSWIELFDEVLAHARTRLHVLSDDADDDEENAYARCNRAMLQRALELAGGPVDLICVWDGSAGDGPGGTDHMVQAVRTQGGHVHWIDTRALATSGDQPLAGEK
jgi:hypothetical protein